MDLDRRLRIAMEYLDNRIISKNSVPNDKLQQTFELILKDGLTVMDACEVTGLNIESIYRNMRSAGIPISGMYDRDEDTPSPSMQGRIIPILAEGLEDGFKDGDIFDRLEEASGYRFGVDPSAQKDNSDFGEKNTRNSLFQSAGVFVLMVRDNLSYVEARTAFDRQLGLPTKKRNSVSKNIGRVSSQVRAYRKYLNGSFEKGAVRLEEILSEFFPEAASKFPKTCREYVNRYVDDPTFDQLREGDVTGKHYIMEEGLPGLVKHLLDDAEIYESWKAILPQDFDSLVDYYPDNMPTMLSNADRKRTSEGMKNLLKLPDFFEDLTYCTRVDLWDIYPEYQELQKKRAEVLAKKAAFKEMGIDLSVVVRMDKLEFLERYREWVKGRYTLESLEAIERVVWKMGDDPRLTAGAVSEILSLSYPACFGEEKHYMPEEIDRQIDFFREGLDSMYLSRTRERIVLSEEGESDEVVKPIDFVASDYDYLVEEGVN